MEKDKEFRMNGLTIDALSLDYIDAVKQISEARMHMTESRRNELLIELIQRELNKTSFGISLISEERKRQIEKERWSIAHDLTHDDGELSDAAACYAMTQYSRTRFDSKTKAPVFWPWESEWWKPTPEDRIRELVKAGALIVAEIDRLQAVEKIKNG